MTYEIIIACIIFYLLGVFSGLYLSKNKIILFSRIEAKHFEKGVSIVLCLVWIGLNILGFIYDKQVSIIFDIVGAGAMSHIIGLDIGTLLSKYMKGKK